MRAFLKALWANLWLFTIPTDPLGLIVVWPAVLIASAAYCFAPTPQRGYFVLLSGVWDVLIGFWLMVSAMKRPRDELYATLCRLKDCSYHEIPMHELLARDGASTVLERFSSLEYMRRLGLPYNHWKNVRVFRVAIGESATLLHDLAAFNIPFIEALIFLRDHPDDADVTEKFYFWHEFGHTLGNEFVVRSALGKGIKHPLLALVLTATALGLRWQGFLCLFMSFVGLWLLHRLLRRQEGQLRAVSEMRADEFALEFLTEEERSFARAHPEELITMDRELSAGEHRERIENLRSAVQNGSSGGSVVRHGWDFPFMPDLMLASAIVIAWTILLSKYLAAPSARGLTILGLLTAVAAAIAYVRWRIHYAKGIAIEWILLCSGRRREGDRWVVPAEPGALPGAANLAQQP